ncbi:hypothetical protein GCM10008955_24500 [Deinococcus malanensis]|uniref:Uncharacterized protein n=1 Tax=Deinococcus malanensis TaxID=1706855 RepID=A0ABQ2EXJ1_9DEIO|nr:hypothetical protein GCM10008955_24500 [Deinococcus malanensis]
MAAGTGEDLASYTTADRRHHRPCDKQEDRTIFDDLINRRSRASERAEDFSKRASAAATEASEPAVSEAHLKESARWHEEAERLRAEVDDLKGRLGSLIEELRREVKADLEKSNLDINMTVDGKGRILLDGRPTGPVPPVPKDL